MPKIYGATLRAARPDDLANILKFFEEANDSNTLSRPRRDYERSVESGGFYLVEVDGDLVAAAGMFYLKDTDSGPLEMGGCHVAPNYRGFNLQKLLTLPRIAYATLFGDEGGAIYTAIKPDNVHSLNSVTKAGFDLLTQDVPLLIRPCVSCNAHPDANSERTCCCDFFYLPIKARCAALEKLLAIRPVIQQKRDGSAQMTVALDIMFLTNRRYHEALKEFVQNSKHTGRIKELN